MKSIIVRYDGTNRVQAGRALDNLRKSLATRDVDAKTARSAGTEGERAIDVGLTIAVASLGVNTIATVIAAINHWQSRNSRYVVQLDPDSRLVDLSELSDESISQMIADSTANEIEILVTDHDGTSK